jgi:formylglycine-generating enzyme required for sulfatase activity
MDLSAEDTGKDIPVDAEELLGEIDIDPGTPDIPDVVEIPDAVDVHDVQEIVPECTAACCGNGVCDWDEDCQICPSDCVCTGCGQMCVSGSCTFSACTGKECGDDGCGGSCGTCTGGKTCEAGECVGGVDVTPGFVQITKGSFWMGSPDGTCPEGYPGSCTSELGRDANETLHYVQLTRDFEMQAHQLTQGEWKAMFGGTNPSSFSSCGDSCPVERVTWFSSLEYANQLSLSKGYPACYELTGCSMGTAAAGTLHGCTVTASDGNPYNCKGYRLPTEAEWEYAYRAGSNTAFHPSAGNDGSVTQVSCVLDPNLDKIGWYCGNENTSTRPVGGKAPNAWGLYDMSGNVREWVWDRYGSYPTGTISSPDMDPLGAPSAMERVGRGGSWISPARICRGAIRYFTGPGDRTEHLGLRLSRTLEP